MRSNSGRTRRLGAERRRVPAVLAVIALALLSACGGGGGQSASTTPTGRAKLTVWSWVPDFQTQVDMYEKAHPNVDVKLVNAGQGAPEYTKLRTALKAGSGAPDVVQIEFQYIPTFTITKDLIDLAEYGANDLKADFPEWVWSQVSPQGGPVYAIPWDTGPMALMYRQDILEKHGIAVPKTWDEFAAAAKKLHDADPDAYLTNLPPNDPGQLVGLMAQAGSRPYKVLSGDTVQISINDAGAKKWAQYWANINRQGLVATDPDFNDQWYKGLSSGRYATWLAAAWGPVFLQGTAKNTSGKWRVAPLPQWSAGENVSANWGGSTLAVTKQSKVPAQAADFAKWVLNNPAPSKLYTTKQFLFPALTSLLNDPEFTDQEPKFYGGQQVNKIYSEASNAVDKTFSWSPFQDYIYSQMNTTVGKALTSKGDIGAALDQLQNAVTGYAESQGFKVQAA
jgi:multiple sugar transport system substrate-binding protein